MTTQAAGLLVLFTFLIVAAVAHAKTMDMSCMAVDDQFVGCEHHMMQEVMDPQGLLVKELKESKGFKEEWKSITHGKGNLTQQHVQALEAYSSDTKFRRMFNEAVERQGLNISTYHRNFTYKSLHFLLTDTLRILRQGCHMVYRGSETKYHAKVGSEVRFGRFTAVVTKKSEAEESGIDGTVFVINSCSAVKIEDYVRKTSEISWLVAPFEQFNVTRVRDTDDHTEITLDHQSFHSFHNCSMFRDFPPRRDHNSSGSAVTFSAPLTLCLCASLWVPTKLFV
ncbi:erythroblast NAD(P)(+)--arginine ADP-ribosyltransferase-like isoform X2 [Brienomyrus brachyistius]|uniref:erythroblast NAD(P)(+)--arginine ADP-ribosyltransferase-like isoform X2 n=1 Tax=Brienomyrus brachyistius TaxID=42636 RepID=UPI0020B389FC|nr:erythroblast NAD(P)(+)--arginine ADP-ribosyltransferase-like isoform X2 [Brienomyrus brachyistius]